MAKTVMKSIVCQPVVDAKTVDVAIPTRVLTALRNAKEAFFALCVQTGKEVLATLMEQERTSVCGARGIPNAERRAVRGGHTKICVTLWGRRIEIPRPRARRVQGAEVSQHSYMWAANRDALDRHTLDAIAVGVSTRRYARSLDALPDEIKQCSISKSAVSRRFVALSCERLKAWLHRSLAQLDLPVLMIDAIHFRSHIMLIVLGIDTEGRKHVLGLRQGATENTAVVRELIADLIERGLCPEARRLIVIDGARALRRAIAECFGDSVLVQRCQVHKLRNVREHLPEELHASVKKAMSDAWACSDAELAQRQLQRLAHSLERSHPSAARSMREGLDETLTLTRLGVDGALYKTLRSTNAIENLNGLTARYLRNVKRWRDGAMLERWVGASLIEVVRGFRKIRGHRDFKHLVAAIKAHCESSTQPSERKVA